MYRFILSLCLCFGVAGAQAQSDVRLVSKEVFPAEDILMWYKFVYVHESTITVPLDLKQGLIKIDKWLKRGYSDQEVEFKVIVGAAKDVQKGEAKREKGGYVKTYSYHFPVSVEVRNGMGKVERTFIIADDTTTFTKDVHAAAFTDKQDADIADYLRQQTYIDVAPAISLALTNAYGVYKVPGVGFRFYFFDQALPAQRDINDIATKAMEELNDLYGFALANATIAKFRGHLAEYDKLLQSPSLSAKERFLCLYNASVCALVIDEFDKSVAYYHEYSKIDAAAGLPVIQKDKKSISPKEAMYKYYYRSFMNDAAKKQETIHLKYRMEL